MRVILIAIGIHTKPCIASLAFTACNWKLLGNRLDIATKVSFSAENIMAQ